ncbi:MAG: hypothetical protein WBF42_19010 [Terracidiphilus sp.]
MSNVLKDYFYWTYKRGSFHYDVMVTLILLFIFIAPQFWNFGDKPVVAVPLAHPMQVMSDGQRGVIVLLRVSDVSVPAGASDSQVKKMLKQAIEPVAGDAAYVERWITAEDSQGNLVWKIWAHR